MSVKIVSRSAWGARPWDGTPASVSLSSRTEFFVHYHGNPPRNSTGAAVPKEIESIHMGQGWSGVGYNFVVDQNGVIYEGRGWTKQGAHCPGHNVSGLGVYVAVGGSQKPTEKALSAVRALYDEACRKTGRTLAKKGHKDGYATACPGTHLYNWVRAGMPAKGYEPSTPPKGGSSGGSTGVARYQATINGLKYGYGSAGPHVTEVGKALVRKGFGRHYKVGPGPQWSDADTKNYSEYQKALGYSGKDADGVPGEASLTKLLGALPSAKYNPPKKSPVKYEPFPGAAWFKKAPRSAVVTAMGKRLVAEGCSKYKQGPGPQWTGADKASYAAWQRKCGYRGADADGWPGKASWDALKVPKV